MKSIIALLVECPFPDTEMTSRGALPEGFTVSSVATPSLLV